MTQLSTPQAELFAGTARIDITPPVGIYHRMWGAATHDQATGIHRPLTATALVLSSDRQKPRHTQYLLAVDHCLLWPQEMRQLRQRIAASCHLEESQLRVCFSHTHGAGLMGLERAALPGGDLIEPYLLDLASRCEQILNRAIAALRPANMLVAEGHCGLAANRDFRDPHTEEFVCGFNPRKAADDKLLAARITDPAGVLLATLVNYACHPTTLAWDNTLISPDYPGAMREVVEAATGAPCFFLLGACGELGPRDGFVGDTEVADRNGRQLGYAALAALESLPPAPLTHFCYSGPVTSGATLGSWEHRPLPETARQQTAVFCQLTVSASLRYGSEFPTDEQLLQQRDQLEQRRLQAELAGNETQVKELRALIERVDRSRIRSGSLPQGTHYPWQTQILRTGQIIWVLLDGEYYSVLQTELRRRFPDWCIIVGTVVNGSTVWYLPDRQSYGLGLYQEQASVLAAGSLETVIETVAKGIATLCEPDSRTPAENSAGAVE